MAKASEDELLDLPSWLDEHMFIKFLQRDFKDFKAIKDFEVEQTSGKGENFTCLVVRVKITVELNGKYKFNINLTANNSM